ncbi:hypothetical protein JNJ66_07010 [Candidatus Saccharibacteria bacterium]|nr:hypothetical protein [Candidatus Saccharibacteria bacterium]
MHSLQSRVLWVGGFLGVLCAMLLAAFGPTPVAHATGEVFTYGPPSSTPGLTSDTITVSGGNTNLPPITLQVQPGTNNYEGSIEGTANDSIKFGCRLEVTVDVTDGTPGTGEVTYRAAQSRGSPCTGLPRGVSSGNITIAAAPAPPAGGAAAGPTCDPVQNVQGTYNQADNNCTYPQNAFPGNSCPAPLTGTTGGICTGPAKNGAGEQVQCSAGTAASWLLCMILDVSLRLIDTITKEIGKLLFIPPFTSDDSSHAVTWTVWGNIRSIANVMFVIVLFVMIFSQATSIGISAYGIKRFAPKIVALAILSNTSSIWAPGLVDAINILTQGIGGIFDAALAASPDNKLAAPLSSGGALNAIAGIMLGVAIAGAVVIFLAANLGAVSLAVIAMYLVLAGRLAVAEIFVATSAALPVLFATRQTEKLGSQAWDFVLSALMIGPAAMLLFGGTQTAAIIMAADASTQNPPDVLRLGLALGVAGAALALAPGLISVGKYSAGRVSQLMRGGLQKANSRLDKTSYGRNRAIVKQAKEQAKQQRFLEKVGSGGGALGRRNAAAAYLGRKIPQSAQIGPVGTFANSSKAVYQQLEDARNEMYNKQAKSHMDNLTRNSAAVLAADDVSYDANKKVLRQGNIEYDMSDPSKRTESINGVKLNSLDNGDLSALNYATQQGLGQKNNIAGSLAIGNILIQQGAMTSDMKKNIVLRSGNGATASVVNNAFNGDARKNGDLHLAYDSVQTVNGQVEFQVGAQKGGADGVMKHVVDSKGLGGVNKEMLGDNNFKFAAINQVERLRAQDKDAFERELTKVNDRVINDLSQAYGRNLALKDLQASGVANPDNAQIESHFAAKYATEPDRYATDLRAIRAAAAQKYKA